MTKRNDDQAGDHKARPSVVRMDDLLGKEVPVLDHGFIRLIDYMGDDAAVVQAARVSYGKGTKTVSEDAALIRYLVRNVHTTPFEMCEIKLHVKLPIFVARQWVRHRTANINEYSARYSLLNKEFYVPAPDKLAKQSTANRQGRGETLDAERSSRIRDVMVRDAEQAFASYDWMLGEVGADQSPATDGLTRELARIVLPVSTYTEWYWKIDLHNLLNFLELRTDSHAQFEIRAYAQAILEIVKLWVPLTYQAFDEYRLGGARLSATAVQYLTRILRGEKITQKESGLSEREWLEVAEKFKLN